MLRKIVLRCSSVLLAGLVFVVPGVFAQTSAYRQTNLASDVPGLADHLDPLFRNPGGMAFVPGFSFFIANTGNGHVLSEDASGASFGPVAFAVPNSAGTASGTPTAIVGDPQALFGGGDSAHSFIMTTIVVTADGGIYLWGIDGDGSFPTEATRVVDHSQSGAVYTAVAILKPDCCAPILAVANFHSGRVETYNTDFAALGSFLDPSLPPGFAPYGLQVIGNQLFVASALQDAAKHDPVAGPGNGIVSIFDFEGRFVRRFATAGSLDAPWGITRASGNFGPFSNDILIGNVGDGIINAFDPATGNFAGQIQDGDGHPLINRGLHALTFGTEGFADPDALYFTAGIQRGQDGLFGKLTTGLVSATRVSVPATPNGASATITVTVSAGPANSGTPTGSVAIEDGGVALSRPALVGGVARFDTVLSGVGRHTINVQYGGDPVFLPSRSETQALVTGLATVLTLTAPTSAAPGQTVTLTAKLDLGQGIPTGQIVFLDGNTSLGSAPLDGAGVAALRTNTLAAGAHSLTATYSGDGKFEGSTSAPVTLTVANPDFALGASPPSATVAAGQSVSFTLTVTPSGGFADHVTFACSPTAGFSCVFSPATVTPASAAATTTLTVTSPAKVSQARLFPLELAGPALVLGVLAFLGAGFRHGLRFARPRGLFLASGASLAAFVAALVLGGCGGSGGAAQPNRGATSITVTAHSGATSHAATVKVTVE